MATCEYPALLVVAENPRIFKGDSGSIVLQLFDLNGEAIDLDNYDTMTLRMRNYPEKDELIEFDCEQSTVEGRCCADFDRTMSSAWLASPYQAQVSIVRFVRDVELISAATGYIPETRDLYVEGVTQSFVVGEIVTGLVSGETAVVREADPHYLNKQLLTLCVISGEFEDGEGLSGDQGGDGSVVGVLGTAVSIDSVFADDVEDLSVVRVGDLLSIDGTDYTVTGFDEVIPEWLTLEESMGLSGTDIAYVVMTYDSATSDVEKASSSSQFAMQIMEIL